MRRFLDAAARVLPSGIAARLDHFSNHKKMFFPYRGPMNGQTARLEIARELLEHCGVTRIIETGTFRGTTTEWFASFGIPVLSAELSPRFAEFSRIRLRKTPFVRIVTANSVDLLKKLVREGDGLTEPTLFYLDAHWYDHLPLREEYEIISEHFAHPIILIDDFQVPDDPGYTFDDYGNGKALTLDYLRPAFRPEPEIFFPATAARWETGARRGCTVITTDKTIAQRIDAAIPLLRRWRNGTPLALTETGN